MNNDILWSTTCMREAEVNINNKQQAIAQENESNINDVSCYIIYQKLKVINHIIATVWQNDHNKKKYKWKLLTYFGIWKNIKKKQKKTNISWQVKYVLNVLNQMFIHY